MTARPQNRPAATGPLSFADIDVHVTRALDGGCVFRFVAPLPHGVEVQEDGTIRLGAAIPPNGTARLSFTLLDETGGGLVFEGLRLGNSESEAQGRPPTVDTGGAYYFDTPFKVTPGAAAGPQTTLVLTQVGPLTPAGTNPYYYLLSVRDASGRTCQHDPKIYNEGDGGPR